MGNTIVVTSVNGYAAGTLLPLLESDSTVDAVIGLDVTPWRGGFQKVSFFREDLCSERLPDIISTADIVCHLPDVDRQSSHRPMEEDDILFEGTRNLMAACAVCNVKKIILLSSTAVYAFQDAHAGLHAEDHPIETTEHTLQARAAAIEKIARDCSKNNPHITLAIVRSANLIGPNIDNRLEQSLSMKWCVMPAGNNAMQFIHESDFGEAVHQFIKNGHAGTFNLASDDTAPLRWCYEQTGTRLIPLPGPLAASISEIGFKLGIYPLRGDQLRLVAQSTQADNTSIKKVLQWQPAYSSKQALMTFSDKLHHRRSQDNPLQAILSWIIKSGKRLKPFLPVLTTFRLGKIPGIRRLVPWLNPDKNSIHYLPVNERIDCAAQTLPSALVHDLIEKASIHVVMDKCGCRMLSDCQRYTHDVGCLFMGETALHLPHGVCRRITREQAHAHADRAMSLGLLPMTGKVRIDNFIYMTPDRGKLLSLCFCCDCCCILTSYKHVPGKYLDGIIEPVKGLEVAVTDDCRGCGACIETCAFGAIAIIDGRAVHSDQCRACGRCERFCPENAVAISIDNAAYADEVTEKIRSYVEF